MQISKKWGLTVPERCVDSRNMTFTHLPEAVSEVVCYKPQMLHTWDIPSVCEQSLFLFKFSSWQT